MSSRIVSEKYPARGKDAVADAIYERRGTRGITPLDANLLNAPDIAMGYSSLLEAIREKGKLAGIIREAMILRIAALNHAAYEWTQHVELGRKEGLTTGQLYIIRDIETPLILPRSRMMDGMMTAALRFTDESTKGVKVGKEDCERLKEEIWKSVGESVDEVYVEAAMVVGVYNMVSRFLVSTDVGGMSDEEVPWPIERTERFVSVPSFPPMEEPRHEIHCVKLMSRVDGEWLVFSNGLNTDWRMWSLVIPRMVDEGYNLLLHSQRGHGRSTMPEERGGERVTTIPLLGKDMGYVVDAMGIEMPVRSVIGVSQGGATTLGFGKREKTRSVVVCGTAGATPVGNKEAWEERTRVVCGKGGGGMDVEAYAAKVGMGKLAKMTVERWFPLGSSCHAGSGRESGRVAWLEGMVEGTSVRGFFHGAKALGEYDVGGVPDVERVLLIAGGLDGGGRVGRGLKKLQAEWSRDGVEYVEMAESGHLPMIDCPDSYSDLVLSFLSEY